MNSFWLALTVFGHMSAFRPPVPVQFARSLVGQNVYISIDGHSGHAVFAGKLGFRDQYSSWQSVCAEVRAPIVTGQFFAVKGRRSSKFGGTVTKAGNIVAKYFRSAQTPDQCAGLQIAVWEAVEDGGAKPNFLDGRFRVRASQTVLNFAQQYYQAIDQPGEAVYLQTGGGQGDDTGGSTGQAQLMEQLTSDPFVDEWGG